MDTLIKLLEVLAKFAWPVVVFLAFRWFRSDISALVKRATKAKVLGSEFEFEAEKERLILNVQKALENQQEVPQANLNNKTIGEDKAAVAEIGWNYNILDYDFTYLEEKVATEPAVAIILISSQIEKILRIILAQKGIVSRRKGVNNLAEEAMKQLNYPESFLEALKGFYKIRNALAHGYTQSNTEELSDVARQGLELLIFAYEHRSQPIYIVEAGLNVFLDQERKQRISEYEGLILGFVAIRGATGAQMYAVTAKKGYFHKNMNVTDEWERRDEAAIVSSSSYVENNVWVQESSEGDITEGVVNLNRLGLFEGRDMRELLPDYNP